MIFGRQRQNHIERTEINLPFGLFQIGPAHLTLEPAELQLRANHLHPQVICFRIGIFLDLNTKIKGRILHRRDSRNERRACCCGRCRRCRDTGHTGGAAARGRHDPSHVAPDWRGGHLQGDCLCHSGGLISGATARILTGGDCNDCGRQRRIAGDSAERRHIGHALGGIILGGIDRYHRQRRRGQRPPGIAGSAAGQCAGGRVNGDKRGRTNKQRDRGPGHRKAAHAASGIDCRAHSSRILSCHIISFIETSKTSTINNG